MKISFIFSLFFVESLEVHTEVHRVVRHPWVEEQLHEDLFANYNKDVRPIDLAKIVMAEVKYEK